MAGLKRRESCHPSPRNKPPPLAGTTAGTRVPLKRGPEAAVRDEISVYKWQTSEEMPPPHHSASPHRLTTMLSCVTQGYIILTGEEHSVLLVAWLLFYTI